LSAIAGVVRADGRDLDPDLPHRLRAATPFLGREGVDQWREGPAALLRFALRVTPQSLNERQPCQHPSGALLVMDGRLDNRLEIAARLGAEAPGDDAPDAALALAALERFSEAALHWFAGDYALALWRPAERRLLLARSPIGWRPLLWSFDGARLGFATEPRTLVEGLAPPRRLNEGFLAEYLSARISSHTDTFWNGVQRLPPGSALELKSGAVRVWRWNEGPFEDLSRLSEPEHVERFRALFDQALADAQRAAGPVAAQLSGGLDSSSVVCRSLELWRAGRLAPVHPISTRYGDPASDEGPWIEAVQQHTGVASQQVKPQPFDAAEAADWCRQTLQLPLRPHTLGVITPAIDAMTRDGRRVLLTGDGGDDGLRGSLAHWPDLARQGRWASLWAETGSAGATGQAARARLLLSAGVLPALSERRRRRLLGLEASPGEPAPAWLRPEWVRRIGLAQRRRAAPAPPALSSFAQQARFGRFVGPQRHVFADGYLTYAAMRGVELRHPFYDLRLARFLAGAAGGVLRKDGEAKHLLREAMRGTLPEEVRTRRGKAGFANETLAAIDRRLAERAPEDLACVRLGWVDPGGLRETLEAFRAWNAAPAGTGGQLPPINAVWNAIAADLWLEHAFGA
jgi:asparagine synthase (glutamine-hydrolysing)